MMRRPVILIVLIVTLVIAVAASMNFIFNPWITVHRDVVLVRSDEQLLDAIEQSDVDALRAIVAGDPSIPREWRSGGQTALHLAATRGDAESVRVLIEAGAKVDARVSKGWGGQSMTPLMYAAAAGSLESVQELLAAGADVDAKSDNGKTAAEIAELYDHPKLADYLRSVTPRTPENARR